MSMAEGVGWNPFGWNENMHTHDPPVPEDKEAPYLQTREQVGQLDEEGGTGRSE